MNEKKLQSCADNVRLSPKSKERIIRNLETITQNMEFSHEEEPSGRPIVRYIMTAVAACLVIAVTAGGIYYHLGRRGEGFSVGSAVTETASVSIEKMQENASDMFSVLGDIQLYAIPPTDRGEIGKCPETVSYITLSKENQEQFSELYQTIDSENPVRDYSFSSNWEDRFLLFFQYAGIYYSILTTRATDGNTYIQLICVSAGESRGYTLTYQADGDFYDKATVLLENPAWGCEIDMDYDTLLYDNLDTLHEILFGNRQLATRFATSIVKLNTQINADVMNAYFISRENQNSDSVQYFNLNRDNFLNFWQILNQAVMGRPSLASDLKTDFMTGGDVEFLMYLEDRSYIEFWHDNVSGQVDLLFHDMPGFQDVLCLKIREEDYQNLKNALIPEEYFDTAYQNMNTVLYERVETELMNQMFGGNTPDVNEIIQRAEQTFTNLEECEYYFSVQESGWLFENHHEGQYFSISQEKQNQLAELFRNLNYADMKKNYQDGGYPIIMYLQDANQQKSLVTIQFHEDFDRAYLSWQPDGKPAGDNYYLELDLDTLNQIAEILSEPEKCFEKQNNLFEFEDAMFTEREVPFGDISDATVRLMFGAYMPYYVIPDENQQATLAELMNAQKWGEPVMTDSDSEFETIQDGEYFDIYFEKRDGISAWSFGLQCQFSGYLLYEHDSMTEVWYNPDLVLEIYHLFYPAEVLYEIDGNGSLYDEPVNKIILDGISD